MPFFGVRCEGRRESDLDRFGAHDHLIVGPTVRCGRRLFRGEVPWGRRGDARALAGLGVQAPPVDSVVVLLVAVAMAVGVAGTVVPLVPGLGLVVAAALVYGLVEGFGAVGVAAFIVIMLLWVAGTLVGVVVPQRAAGSGGAPRRSILAGAVGAVVGFFVVPIVGLVLGGALGIYVAERIRTGNSGAAWRTTKATLKGFGLAALAQLGAGLTMAGVWVVWVVAACVDAAVIP